MIEKPSEHISEIESEMSMNSMDLNVNLHGKRKLKFYEKNEGGLISTDGKKIYYMGIIDILTAYNAAKKMEYVIKSIQYEYG